MKLFIPLTMTYINMYTPSIRSEVHKQKLKSHNKDTIYIHQLTTAESQDAKMAVTKEVAGYIMHSSRPTYREK